MLAEALANFNFLIPNGFKVFDQVIFRGFDPGAPHYQVAAIEIQDRQISRAFEAANMVAQTARQSFPLGLGGGGVQLVRVRFAGILPRRWERIQFMDRYLAVRLGANEGRCPQRPLTE
jgi:hypothetical protein